MCGVPASRELECPKQGLGGPWWASRCTDPATMPGGMWGQLGPRRSCDQRRLALSFPQWKGCMAALKKGKSGPRLAASPEKQGLMGGGRAMALWACMKSPSGPKSIESSEF